MATTSFDTFITLSGDSTTLSGPNVGHHGWGEPFSGVAQVDSPQPTYQQPWDLTAIQKDYSSIGTACINYGDAGAVVSTYLKSQKYQKVLAANPVYALLMFGQDETDVTTFGTNLTTMLGDLIAANITPVVLSQVPPRVPPNSDPAPKGSISGKMAAEAGTVVTNYIKNNPKSPLTPIFVDVYTTLYNLFTSKGGTWVEDNINYNKTGLVHYSTTGAVIIAQQIAALLPTDITQYLGGTTVADSFACTANCS